MIVSVVFPQEIDFLHIFIFSGRTGYVKIRSLKVGLMAMSTATLEEKYRCKKNTPP